MNNRRNIGLLIGLCLLAGCAQNNATTKDNLAESFSAPFSPSESDELLNFGVNMANMSAASRAETCRGLVKRQKEADTTLKLQLMLGRLLSDACGDIPKIIEAVNAIPPTSLADDRLQRLVAIHLEALKNQQSQNKKLASMERKQKTVQSVLDTKDAKNAKKDDSRLLREKLDAIRTMEKQMDESSGGN